MRAQSVGVLESGLGGHRRFLSPSSSMVASTYPARAAPKHGNPLRIGCRVISSGPQMGTSGGYCSPGAAQWTITASFAIAISPPTSSMRPRSARST
jgi:hypothetical protein